MAHLDLMVGISLPLRTALVVVLGLAIVFSGPLALAQGGPGGPPIAGGSPPPPIPDPPLGFDFSSASSESLVAFIEHSLRRHKKILEPLLGVWARDFGIVDDDSFRSAFPKTFAAVAADIRTKSGIDLEELRQRSRELNIYYKDGDVSPAQAHQCLASSGIIDSAARTFAASGPLLFRIPGFTAAGAGWFVIWGGYALKDKRVEAQYIHELVTEHNYTEEEAANHAESLSNYWWQNIEPNDPVNQRINGDSAVEGALALHTELTITFEAWLEEVERKKKYRDCLKAQAAANQENPDRRVPDCQHPDEVNPRSPDYIDQSPTADKFVGWVPWLHDIVLVNADRPDDPTYPPGPHAGNPGVPDPGGPCNRGGGVGNRGNGAVICTLDGTTIIPCSSFM